MLRHIMSHNVLPPHNIDPGSDRYYIKFFVTKGNYHTVTQLYSNLLQMMNICNANTGEIVVPAEQLSYYTVSNSVVQ